MLRTLPDSATLSIVNYEFQDSEQLTKFVVGIVRKFLMTHGFAKNRLDTICEKGIREVVNTPPTKKKRKRDLEEAQLPMEPSFSMNTTDSRENGRYQMSIDLTEFTKHDCAEVIHAVCVSATQSRSLLHDPLRIPLWIKSKTYSGLTHGLVGLTKSIHVLEPQPGFLRTPILPPQWAVLVSVPIKGREQVTIQTLQNGSSKRWK